MGEQPCPDICTGWCAPVSRHRAQGKGQGSTLEQEVKWWKTWASSACTEVTGNCHFPGYSSKKSVKQTNYIHKSLSLQPPFSDVYLHTENILTNHLLFAWRKLLELFRDASWPFLGKDSPSGSWVGCTVQSSKPGGKSFPPGPGDQSPNTQSINSTKSSSAAKKTSFFQRMEHATTVDWVLPLWNVILTLIEIGQTGKTYCLQKKGLLIHCSLPTENSPATIQDASRRGKKEDNNIKKSN